MAKTLVGVFDDQAAAYNAVRELQSLGIPQDHIRLMNNSDIASGREGTETGTDQQGWMEKVRTWFSSLFEEGSDREQADLYSEAYRRGHYIVVVDVRSEMVDQSAAILNKYGTVDLQRRSEQWRSSGYRGYDRNARPYTTEERDREISGLQSDTGAVAIPVVQEEIQIGKQVVQRQGVRIHSYIEEKPVEEIVRLREERIDVQRRPVDRPATGEDLTFKDRSVDVAAYGEEPVVGKTARVVEEVTVGKNVQERDQKVKETVRRKDVKVDKVDAGRSATPHKH